MRSELLINFSCERFKNLVDFIFAIYYNIGKKKSVYVGKGDFMWATSAKLNTPRILGITKNP